MDPIEVKFGEWLPDLPSYNNPGVVEAKNAYPFADGYGPFNAANGSGDTSTEVVTGSEMFFRNDGTFIIAAGSSTRLLVRTSTVTETTGYTALDTGHVWRFERFGDYIIAVTPNNAPQYLTDIDSDTTWSALTGTPPKASVVGRVGDFIVMGDLTDIDASVVPNRIRWSPFNNPLGNYVTDRGELSDYRDLDPKYGRVTGITNGVVFQERAIHRMVFVGTPKVFDIEPISIDRGCIAPDSLVEIDTNVYFLSQDGFYVTNGAAVAPIGANRIDRWFNGKVDAASIKRTHGAVNWPEQSIVWSFVTDNTGEYSEQIIYSFGANRWSSAETPIHYLVRAKTDAVTIGDLATLYPGGIGDVGVIGNPEWLSSDLLLAAWTESGAGSEFSTMNGASLEATITTGDRQLIPGRRTHIGGLLPVVENATGNTQAQVLCRDKLAGTQTLSDKTTEGANGFCPQKVDTKLAALRMVVPSGAAWQNATALFADVRPSGAR